MMLFLAACADALFGSGARLGFQVNTLSAAVFPPGLCSGCRIYQHPRNCSVDLDRGVRQCTLLIQSDSESQLFLNLQSSALEEFQGRIRANQFFNRIPGNGALRKRFQAAAFGYEAGFTPRTFLFPEEADSAMKTTLQNAVSFQQPAKHLYYKPDAGFGAVGQRIVLGSEDMRQLLSDYEAGVVEPGVLQESEETLLLAGHKFDIRVEVLVTSLTPFQGYMWRGGFYKAARESFAHPTEENKGERHRFFSNVHLNNPQENLGYEVEPGVSGFGALRSLTGLMWMHPERFDLSPAGLEFAGLFDSEEGLYRAILERISAVAKTGIELLAKRWALAVNGSAAQMRTFPRTRFQLLGLDLFLTRDLRPGIFEVNSAPGLDRLSNVEPSYEGFQVLRDALNLVGAAQRVEITRTMTGDEDLLAAHEQQIQQEITRAGNFQPL